VETTSDVTFANIVDSGLSASRLMASDASKKLVSVDIKDWIAGTANQVVVSDDLDGSVTLSLPYDISDASNTALVGFTATSILGALNELAAGSAGGKGKWVYTHSGAAAASHTFASGEFLGAGSAAAPVLSAYADVYLNGQLLVNGADYNYSGAAVTLTFNMQADDVLVVIIR
jgi:hypothetical protein